MKKTITLAALVLGLGSSALAVTLEEATVGKASSFVSDQLTNIQISSPTVVDSSVYQRMTVTAVFDWSDVSKVMAETSGRKDFIQLLHGSGTDMITFSFANSNTGIGFTTAHKDNLSLSCGDITNDYLYNGQLTLTIQLNGGTTGVTVYALKNDGTLATLGNKSDMGWGPSEASDADGRPYNNVWVCGSEAAGALEGFYAYNSVLLPAEILTVSKAAVGYTDSTKPVPEPATATLSLLALAGLAARRRRK